MPRRKTNARDVFKGVQKAGRHRTFREGVDLIYRACLDCGWTELGRYRALLTKPCPNCG